MTLQMLGHAGEAAGEAEAAAAASDARRPSGASLHQGRSSEREENLDLVGLVRSRPRFHCGLHLY